MPERKSPYACTECTLAGRVQEKHKAWKCSEAGINQARMAAIDIAAGKLVDASRSGSWEATEDALLGLLHMAQVFGIEAKF